MKEEENKKQKGKSFGIIVGIIAFAVSYLGVQYFFKKDVASELNNAVIELNKQAPVQVDEFTRLDSAASVGKTKFIYYYTLVNSLKAEVDLDTVNKYTKPAIIKSVKESDDLKPFRKNNITLDYSYFDKNGEFVMNIAVTPDLYKE